MYGNPDFELYDNVGRTTEQINAHKYDLDTDDDLLRWGLGAVFRRTARQSPPADSGAGVRAWTDLLAHARTTREVAPILDQVADGADGALPRLHQFLEQSAEWFREAGDTARAAAFERHAETLRLVGDDLVHTVSDLLVEARGSDRAQAARATGSRTTTAAQPPAPASPPGPGRPEAPRHSR